MDVTILRDVAARAGDHIDVDVASDFLSAAADVTGDAASTIADLAAEAVETGAEVVIAGAGQATAAARSIGRLAVRDRRTAALGLTALVAVLVALIVVRRRRDAGTADPDDRSSRGTA